MIKRCTTCERLRCKLGIHRWIYLRGGYARPLRRVCQHCGLVQAWAMREWVRL